MAYLNTFCLPDSFSATLSKKIETGPARYYYFAGFIFFQLCFITDITEDNVNLFFYLVSNYKTFIYGHLDISEFKGPFRQCYNNFSIA